MKITEEALKEFLTDINEGVFDDLKSLISGNKITGVKPKDGGFGGNALLIQKAAKKAEEMGIAPLKVSEDEKMTAKTTRTIKELTPSQIRKANQILRPGKYSVDSALFAKDEDF